MKLVFIIACAVGETCAGRTMDRACRRHCRCGRGRLALGVLAARMSDLLEHARTLWVSIPLGAAAAADASELTCSDQRFAGYIRRAAPDTRMLAPGSEVISARSRDGTPMSSP
jgi:hypothetical protein